MPIYGTYAASGGECDPERFKYTLFLLGSLPDQSACPASRGHRDDNFQFIASEREWTPLFGSGRIWKRRRLDAQDKLVTLDRALMRKSGRRREAAAGDVFRRCAATPASRAGSSG